MQANPTAPAPALALNGVLGVVPALPCGGVGTPAAGGGQPYRGVVTQSWLTPSPDAVGDAAVRARLTPPHNPVLMVVSGMGWRSVGYCATSIIGGLLALLAGIVGLVVLPLVAWATATVEAFRLRLLGIPRAGPLPSGPVRHPWDTQGLKEGNLAVWGMTVLFGLVDLLPGGILVLLVLGVTNNLVSQVFAGAMMQAASTSVGLLVILIIGLYVAWALAAGQAVIVEKLLRPRAELSQQVAALTSSRRELVDVFAAERRRIERDLHDGAQQHLVLLSMQLGEADFALDRGRTGDARKALNAAQSSMEAAMTSLRETVRGIHPQILTDRGLAPAVQELAERQPVPVQLTVSGLGQPSEPVALAVYYLVSEALTNAAKHSQATEWELRLVLADPVVVEVRDNGRGGAVVQPGRGLSGMIERVQALGGQCTITSPPGGPTVITAAVPDPTAHVTDEGGGPVASGGRR